jgi:hypothetical protein
MVINASELLSFLNTDSLNVLDIIYAIWYPL